MDKVLRLGIDPTAAEEGARRYRDATNTAADATDRLRQAREKNAAAAQNEGAAARVTADADRAAANYAYQLAAIRVAVAQGALDEASATAQATQAQQRYNDTLLRTLASNRQQIQSSAEGRAVFTQTAMLLDSQGGAAEKAGVGTSRLAREMITLTDRMVGFNPVAGQSVYILSQMAGNKEVVLGVIAGVAILVGVYELATRKAQEERKASEELIDSLHKQAVARKAVGDTPADHAAALAAQRADLQAEIAKLQAQRDSMPTEIAETGVSQTDILDSRIAKAQSQLLKLGEASDELQKQIDKQRDQSREDLTRAIQAQDRTDSIANSRRDSLRGNIGADPDTLARINIQYDLQAKLADNLTKAENARAEAIRSGDTGLIALIETEHRHADAAARSAASDAQAALQAERLFKIRYALLTVSGARDVGTNWAAPLQGGNWDPQTGRWVAPAAPNQPGMTFYGHTTGNQQDLMHGGIYAPNSLTPITQPGTGHIRFAGDGITGTQVGGGDFRADTFPEWLRGANSDISGSWVGKNAGKAAGIANLALGLGGAAFQNSGVGMGVSGALQYGQMGAQVAGPLGAIVGAVGGFVKGIFDHEAKMKELQAAQQSFNESIEARQAAAAGDPQTAQRLELAIRQEKELDDARKAGMDKVSIAALAEVQAEERSAQAKEQAAKSAEFDLSIQARREAALGNPDAAAAIQRQIDEEHELAQARADGMSASQIAALKAVQAEEDLATARQKTADITALEAQNADTVAKSLSGYASATYDKTHPDQANTPFIYSSVYRQLTEEYGKIISNPFMTQDDRDKAKSLYLQQIAYAQQQYETQQAINANAQQATLLQQQLQTDQQQLSIAQQALNAQQQTVDTLQRVYDSLDQFSKSLLVGSQSPLSPYDQLKEAGKQFFALSGSARGGDQGAAGQLQGSGQQYLTALRGYYGSSAGYQQGFTAVQAEINAVKDKFGQQITDAQRQLDQLQQQTSLAQQAVNNDQQQLAILKQQADALNGIGNATSDAANTLHTYNGPLVNAEGDAAAGASSLRLIELNTGGSMTALQALQTYSYNSWQTQQDILFELRSMHSDLVGQLDDIRVAEQAAAVRSH